MFIQHWFHGRIQCRRYVGWWLQDKGTAAERLRKSTLRAASASPRNPSRGFVWFACGGCGDVVGGVNGGASATVRCAFGFSFGLCVRAARLGRYQTQQAECALRRAHFQARALRVCSAPCGRRPLPTICWQSNFATVCDRRFSFHFSRRRRQRQRLGD